MLLILLWPFGSVRSGPRKSRFVVTIIQQIIRDLSSPGHSLSTHFMNSLLKVVQHVDISLSLSLSQSEAPSILSGFFQTMSLSPVEIFLYTWEVLARTMKNQRKDERDSGTTRQTPNSKPCETQAYRRSLCGVPPCETMAPPRRSARTNFVNLSGQPRIKLDRLR